MKQIKPVTTTVLLAVLTLGSATVFADDHGRRGPHTQQGVAQPHAQGTAVHRAEPRRFESVQRNDRSVAPRAVGPQVVRPYPVRPYVVRPGVRPYVVRPYYRPYAVAPYYSAPYFFRPHYRFGFGISLGYPVPFFAYPYPLAVYGYAAPAAPVVVGPGSIQYGGVSLEITPADANVYVDGNYAGLAGDFDGTRQPLTLAGGAHHVEIDAPGYRQWAFDVNVLPGQIVPYRGQLQGEQ